MTYSINWPITMRSAVPFRSGNYIFPFLHSVLMTLSIRRFRKTSVSGSPVGVRFNVMVKIRVKLGL